jgi:N-acetylmuramic acid 6-phosphate etherase
MSTAKEKARDFLTHQRAFRLGALPTESSHPRTTDFSQTIQEDLQDGLRMLADVDADILPMAEEVFASSQFHRLIDEMTGAINSGKRIYFTGCGATGRLSILLEAAWRGFWQELAEKHPRLHEKLPDLHGSTHSVMAGGDHALIRSVEGFEDFADFGKYQLGTAGASPGDVVVAITEGGETPFVIGTAWKGVEVGAAVFFVYNNPSDVLCKHVHRSREVIDDDRITKLDLASGPMAIAGSTRMQATTSELLVVGAALEISLATIIRKHLSDDELSLLGIADRQADDYGQLFARLLDQLRSAESVDTLARMTVFEETLYRNKGLITYSSDRFLLDVLTDTTERAPTFRLPPFRKCDDTTSSRSWAFVKNPCCSTRKAWKRLLCRQPRGIDWDVSTYNRLNAPEGLRAAPPRLDNSEILKFQIGNELEPSRYQADDSALVLVAVGPEVLAASDAEHPLGCGFLQQALPFKRTAAICIGPVATDLAVDELFHVPCDLPDSPLNLFARLAVKLVLNTTSTATMARMDRVVGNWMVCVETTNKKLIDRGTRLIAEFTGLSYEDACFALHETIEEVEPREKRTKDALSPVALAIKRIGVKDRR